MEADAQLARGLDLRVDEPVLAAGEEVQVIRAGRAPGQQQLGQAHAGGHAHAVGVDPAPDLVQLRQPAEQGRFLHRRDVARQRLRQVMVRVDEAGQHDLARGVDAAHGIGSGFAGRLTGPHGGHAVVLDQHPAAREAPARVVHGNDEPRGMEERPHLGCYKPQAPLTWTLAPFT